MAVRLHKAARNQEPIAQWSATENYTLDCAYECQEALMDLRKAEGHRVVGVKMGFTSVAKMEQMGVSDMIIGVLTSDMEVKDGAALTKGNYIHPRAEPEIAFRLSKDINGPVQLEQVLNYVDGVAAAVEVIDSRYENFKFSLEDVVADNCSSTAFALGPWCTVPQGLNGLDMDLRFNGESVAAGSSNAILDNPFAALAAATRLASEYNIELKAGMVVLAGAATAAHFIEAGSTVEAVVDGLGTASFTVA